MSLLTTLGIKRRDCIMVKAKVKCTLVQGLRLCTGRTAHRGSRGKTLLILNRATRRGWGVSVTPRPLFTPGKDPVPIMLYNECSNNQPATYPSVFSSLVIAKLTSFRNMYPWAIFVFVHAIRLQFTRHSYSRPIQHNCHIYLHTKQGFSSHENVQWK